MEINFNMGKDAESGVKIILFNKMVQAGRKMLIS
jgi:hypothetical protein